MPCVVDTSYEDAQAAEAAKAELNLVTRLLCELCKASSILPAEHRRWYAKHREADERREAQERAQADRSAKAERTKAEKRAADARVELARAEADLNRLGRR